MINWYGVQILAFLALGVVNFFLILTSVISLLIGLLIWILVLPVLFTVLSFIVYKLEEKGYIHKDELSR